LSQIQQDFEKRAKEAEARYTEKLNEIRKSLDQRWRQLDKFESSVKQYAETKTTWRRKLSAKEGELEVAKVISFSFFYVHAKSFSVLTRSADDIIGLDCAVGHTEAAHAGRLERGQSADDTREQCGASLGQRAESTRRRGGEDGDDESEDHGGGQQVGSAGEGI